MAVLPSCKAARTLTLSCSSRLHRSSTQRPAVQEAASSTFWKYVIGGRNNHPCPYALDYLTCWLNSFLNVGACGYGWKDCLGGDGGSRPGPQAQAPAQGDGNPPTPAPNSSAVQKSVQTTNRIIQGGRGRGDYFSPYVNPISRRTWPPRRPRRLTLLPCTRRPLRRTR
jgi:hypothetical protein